MYMVVFCRKALGGWRTEAVKVRVKRLSIAFGVLAANIASCKKRIASFDARRKTIMKTRILKALKSAFRDRQEEAEGEVARCGL